MPGWEPPDNGILKRWRETPQRATILLDNRTTIYPHREIASYATPNSSAPLFHSSHVGRSTEYVGTARMDFVSSQDEVFETQISADQILDVLRSP